MIIPNKFVAIIFLFGIARLFLTNELTLSSALYGGLIGYGFLALIAVVTGAMGGGDVKLMGAAGFWLGSGGTVLALMLGFLLGSIIGVALIALKIKTRKDYIPFGPYLCIGIFVSLLYGTSIIEWYLNFV